MKKFIFAMLLVCSGSVLAAGPYDGIWVTEALGNLTINENNGTVIVVRHESDGSEWEALMGPRIDSILHLETLISGVDAVFDVTMTSATTFIAVQQSCHPIVSGDSCLLPDGYAFSGEKIW